jgi:5-methylcytosine-specific restriction protein B
VFENHKKGRYGVISTEKLREESETFEGKPPLPYYNYFDHYNPSPEQKQSIFDAIKRELDRTNKSGFLEYNDEDFADYIFSQLSQPLLMTHPQPLNSILYGPPGTGKTYRTIDLAVKIVKPEEYIEGGHDQNKLVFDELVDQGRVVFTTFHQSTTYEDFIEGIKPVMVENGEEEASGEIQYEIQSGIFKQLVEKIEDRKKLKEVESTSFHIPEEKFEQPVNKVSLGDSTDEKDQAIYDYCIENDCIAIRFGQDIDFTGVKDTKEIRERYRKAGIEVESANDYNVSAIERLVLWMEPGQLVMVSNGNKKLRAIGEVTGDYYFDPEAPIRYAQFRKVKWHYTDIDIPIKEVYPKLFSQQTIYQMDHKSFNTDFFSGTEKSVDQYEDMYVMIIDEINRGNIAQIFGELITLLEEDKRAGAPNAFKVKLPYSKSEFTIPKNLHIIGTMNTADRSVEALDTALRRRFSFEEMMPRPEVIARELQEKDEWEGLRISEVLRTINERIELLVDRDHLIGHSYFLPLKQVAEKDFKRELITIFSDKIIPLLQEYFYNDYVKIGMVLGEGFIRMQRHENNNFAHFPETLETDYQDKRTFHIVNAAELAEGNTFRKALGILMNQEVEQHEA